MPVLLALHAMATRFELVLHPSASTPPEASPSAALRASLRAAGEAALAEIERIERLLSAYRPDSDIGRINAGAAAAPVRVTAETCRVLQQCLALSRQTGGAFDVTVGPLVRTWRAAGAAGTMRSADLEAARRLSGADLVHVDEETLTVTLERPGAAVDLGAAGKGYAIDVAIETLRDAGVTCALLHGGTSSVHAIGTPPDAEGWRVAWAGPEGAAILRDSALSVSAGHGRVVTIDGETFGHVIDPRTGSPVDRTRGAGVTGPSSFLCDALSTAVLVRGPAWLPEFRQMWPGYDAWAHSAHSA